MSLASDARDAVRDRPFLHAALRAGVVNYRAAAELLDVGDVDSVAAALRRYADDLPAYETEPRSVTVRLRSGVGLAQDEVPDDTDDVGAEPVVRVGGVELVAGGGGSLTAVLAEGDVDADALHAVLGRLSTANVLVDAAGVADDALVVVVPRREGATALRLVEGALEAVPDC